MSAGLQHNSNHLMGLFVMLGLQNYTGTDPSPEALDKLNAVV